MTKKKYFTSEQKLKATQYKDQKWLAKRRKILFKLSLEEWSEIWDQSGHWEERGCRIGQYVMSRYGDIGPYEVGNVFIQLHTDNIKQALVGKAKTAEHIENKRIAEIGKTYSDETNAKKAAPRCSCLICKKETNITGLTRFHNH